MCDISFYSNLYLRLCLCEVRNPKQQLKTETEDTEDTEVFLKVFPINLEYLTPSFSELLKCGSNYYSNRYFNYKIYILLLSLRCLNLHMLLTPSFSECVQCRFTNYPERCLNIYFYI